MAVTFDHTRIRVSNLENSIDWYCKTCGFQVLKRTDKSPSGNLLYALVYNLIGMALAAAGLLHPVAAALIMLVSSFWVTTRALSGHGKL